jgi:hypothetical protein
LGRKIWVKHGAGRIPVYCSVGSAGDFRPAAPTHPEQPLQRFPRPNLKDTAEAVLGVMAAGRASKAGSYRQKWQGAKN